MTFFAFTNNEVPKRPFDQGAEAFHAGKPDTVCPYPISGNDGKRMKWMSGYYEARTTKNLAEAKKEKICPKTKTKQVR